MYKYKCTDTEKSAVSKSFNRTMWAISGGFFALIAVISFGEYRSIVDSGGGSILVVLILAAVYTVSGMIIRRRVEVPLLKLTFWKAGGFITVIIGLIISNIFLFAIYLPMDYSGIIYWAWEFAFGYVLCWLVLCLPALEISLVIQAVIGLIMKKINSSKTAAMENTAENDDISAIN